MNYSTDRANLGHARGAVYDKAMLEVYAACHIALRRWASCWAWATVTPWASRPAAAGGVPDEQFLGDAAGSIAYLRSLTYANGKVGTIGYCSGGRQSFLAACSLPLDAAVDCYGARVVNPPPPGIPFHLEPCGHLADRLSCPLLGLFGEEDKMPAPAETAQLAAILEGHHKTYEFHTYPGAGHSFFATDRPSYRPEAANDGWNRVFDWFGRYLSS